MTGHEIITVSGWDCVPHESHLLFKGKFAKQDGSTYNLTEMNILVKRILYFYDSIRYDLQRMKIEAVSLPGRVFELMSGKIQSVIIDRNDGSFSCSVDLKDIFGFCKTFTQVVIGCEHRIHLHILSKSNDLWTDLEQGTLTMKEVIVCMKTVERIPSFVVPKTIHLQYQRHVCRKLLIKNKSVETSFTGKRRNIDKVTVAFLSKNPNSYIVQKITIAWNYPSIPKFANDPRPFDRIYVFNNRLSGKRVEFSLILTRFTASIRAYVLTTHNEFKTIRLR